VHEKRHAQIRAEELARGTPEKDVELLLEIKRRQSSPRANTRLLTQQALDRGGGDVARVCGTKKRYSSEQRARGAARKRENDTAAPSRPLRAYHCMYCASWHLTHQPK
jgi:hypothetical protein